MNISTITHIKPTGDLPFQSEHGPLYSFIVSFEDNTQGKANSKSPDAPYKPGDRVGYEVKGSYKGMNNIKITKNPDKFAPTAEPAKWTAIAAAPQTHVTVQAPRQATPALPPGTDFDAKMRAQALLYVESVQMAHFVSDRLDSMGNGKLSQEHFQGCASSLYIQANKDGLRVPQSAPKPLQVAGNGQGGGPATHPDLETALPF